MEMEKLLNKLLADLVVEYHKLQSHHWYLRGYHFYDDHPLLNKFYDQVAEMVDGTAEDMLKLELKPESTMAGFLKISSIKESTNEELDSDAAFRSAYEDYQVLRDDVVAVKKAADEQGDYLTSALMDDYIEAVYKQLWMLRQVLKE